jgi:hypothetical protein
MLDPNRTLFGGGPARPPVPHTLVARYDPMPLAPSHRRSRVRPTIPGSEAWDAVLAGARLAPGRRRPRSRRVTQRPHALSVTSREAASSLSEGPDRAEMA